MRILTEVKVEQLKKVKASLSAPLLSIDSKIANSVHFKQILLDIDPLSSFSSSFSMELIKLEGDRDKYKDFSTITSIVDSAIRYYEEELKYL